MKLIKVSKDEEVLYFSTKSLACTYLGLIQQNFNGYMRSKNGYRGYKLEEIENPDIKVCEVDKVFEKDNLK